MKIDSVAQIYNMNSRGSVAIVPSLTNVHRGDSFATVEWCETDIAVDANEPFWISPRQVLLTQDRRCIL
ncbi:hypothetical protein RISK_005067 [Rhodopirellula islandica]|uniref:Uncharacterized protein n=1 Tax=Rhodopirellula islandica TaxID=595434 RepID=A0A0J1B8J6_RHOIS|nr:hypothetical protein RISK_005067 [Rhodopirellula islandica]